MKEIKYKVVSNCVKCPLSFAMYAGVDHRLCCIIGDGETSIKYHKTISDKWVEDFEDNEIIIPPNWCQVQRYRVIFEKI